MPGRGKGGHRIYDFVCVDESSEPRLTLTEGDTFDKPTPGDDVVVEGRGYVVGRVATRYEVLPNGKVQQKTRVELTQKSE